MGGINELAVWHVGGADFFAGTTDQAMLQVLLQLGAGREIRLRQRAHERDATARRFGFILRQAIGNDIIFDIEKSVSTEGDSGVYLQYAHARTNSLLEKAGTRKSAQHSESVQHSVLHRETHEIERLLYRFPEVVERAGKEFAPHYITTYLTELAGSFNNFYAHEQC